jgi:citrate synthase
VNGMFGDGWLSTEIGRATSDSIEIRGRELAREVMGEMSFSAVAWLLVTGRAPSEEETRLFDAVLCSLADHGLTPTALAARLTYTGAPEAVQGAVAAGLLGGGSVFLGPVADTAEWLGGVLAQMPAEERSERAALEAAAGDAVRAARGAGRRIPGLGHPVHKTTDPRTPRLYEIARETGLAGPHLHLLELVAAAQRSFSGRHLPINGAGAAGAALGDLGFSPPVARGFALLARTAGLIGHLAEEAERPLGMRLWREVDAAVRGEREDAGPEPP